MAWRVLQFDPGHLYASADGPAWFLYSTEGMQVAHIIYFGSVTKSYGTWGRRNVQELERQWSNMPGNMPHEVPEMNSTQPISK